MKRVENKVLPRTVHMAFNILEYLNIWKYLNSRTKLMPSACSISIMQLKHAQTSSHVLPPQSAAGPTMNSSCTQKIHVNHSSCRLYIYDKIRSCKLLHSVHSVFGINVYQCLPHIATSDLHSAIATNTRQVRMKRTLMFGKCTCKL